PRDRSRSPSGDLLPQGDVPAALARERLALPAAPPPAQRHPPPRHQVELRRPDVAERYRDDVHLFAGNRVVMRDETLRDDVVLVEAEMRGRDVVTPTLSAPGLARSRATIASDRSIPCTRTPRCASGSAILPVPMPSSSAAPSPASCARKWTAGSTTLGANISALDSSYRAANRPPK